MECYSKTGLRRYKFHAGIHFADLIPQLGSTMNFFGGFLESFLRFIIKGPSIVSAPVQRTAFFTMGTDSAMVE